MQTTQIDDDELWTYHLRCEHCGYDWWSRDAFPLQCPKCGENPYFRSAGEDPHD